MMHRIAIAMVSKLSCIAKIKRPIRSPRKSVRMILYRCGTGQKVVAFIQESSAAVLLSIRHFFTIDFPVYFEIILVCRGSGRGFVWNRVG